MVIFECLQCQLDWFRKYCAAAIAATQEATCDTIAKMIEARISLKSNRMADIVDSMVNEISLQFQEKLRNMRSLSADLSFSLTSGPGRDLIEDEAGGNP